MPRASRANQTGGREPSGRTSFSAKLVNGMTHRLSTPSQRRLCGEATLRTFVTPGSGITLTLAFFPVASGRPGLDPSITKLRVSPFVCATVCRHRLSRSLAAALVPKAARSAVEPDLFRDALIVQTGIILDEETHAECRRSRNHALSDRAMIREILPEDRGPHRRLGVFGSNETFVFARGERLQDILNAWLQFRDVIQHRLFEGNVIAAKTAVQGRALEVLPNVAFASDDVRDECDVLPNVTE
jgi:hypothetical protein